MAERSSRPGATTTAFFVTSPTPRQGSAIWTMLTPAIAGFSGWTHSSCSRAAARIRSPASESSRASSGVISKPERLRVGDRVPHAAVGDVDRERAEPLDLELRVEALGEAGHVRELDALALAVAAGGARLDDAAGRLQPDDGLRLAHLDHARLEQHRRHADRVRARTWPGTRSAP